MKFRRYYGFILVGALVFSLVSVFQSAPGYMDADYYTAGGIQLAAGNGFHEPFIWNYLNNPAGIPTPSHLYWMPLASILAAIGAWISGGVEFVWMRTTFVFMAALLAPFAVSLAGGMLREQRYAWLGGLCALFSGIYWVYLTLPETVGLYMLLGAGVIGLVGGVSWLRIDNRKALGLGLLAGILSGLMHLSRADGILWLIGSVIWVGGQAFFGQKVDRKKTILRIVIILGSILLGYLIVMSAWYARNFNMFGSLMPPGNSRTLWLTDYNQTYDYPASELTFETWFRSGAASILQSRWQALKLNLANLLVVQGGIVLLPLMIIGLWVMRKNNRVRFLLFMWLLSFLAMTVAFPFAGARGGYLHSGAAFQLYLWALVPVGLEAVVEWGGRKRGWIPGQAFGVFGTGLMIIALAMSGFLFTRRVIGPNWSLPVWAESERIYRSVDEELSKLGITSAEIGAVNNPPGFYLATGRSSIVIPNGGLGNLLSAAQKYNASYLILEQGQANLSELFAKPGDQEGLVYLSSVAGVQIYRIIPYECDC